MTKEELKIYRHNYHLRTYKIQKPKRDIYLRQFRIDKEDFIDSLKNKPCKDCYGWFEPCQMDWDHRNPSEKEFNVSQMGTRSRLQILKEINKCDLVCANCHRIRTQKQAIFAKDI